MKTADAEGHELGPPRGQAEQGQARAPAGKQDWHPPPPVPRWPGKTTTPWESSSVYQITPTPPKARTQFSDSFTIRYWLRVTGWGPSFWLSGSLSVWKGQGYFHHVFNFHGTGNGLIQSTRAPQQIHLWWRLLKQCSKGIGLEAAFELPEWRGTGGEITANVKQPLGDFSEQEKRANRNSASRFLHGGGIHEAPWPLLLRNQNWNCQVHTPGVPSALPRYRARFMARKKDEGESCD